MTRYKYLFGPVPSRRLRLSLGVDLTPFKTCSFDCIFCQLGRTTHKTLARAEYVPVDDVIEELDDWIRSGGSADYITLSGSGEPTLNSRFGRVIDFARTAAKIPVAILTNATTLGDPEVRAEAAKADVVKLSLSAWDEDSLRRINRPSSEVSFAKLVESQRLFRRDFSGKIWLEVVLIRGFNTAPAEVAKIAELARSIGPDRVQLNTAVRPPAEDFALAAPRHVMEESAQIFDPPAEIIAEFAAHPSEGTEASETDILEMLRRRPCTFEQIAQAFGMHLNEVSKYVGKLTRTGLVDTERRDDQVYYVAYRGEDTDHADL